MYNGVSGWTHREPFRGGDVLDLHDYNVSGPGMLENTPTPGNNGNGGNSEVGTGGVLVSVVGKVL